MHSCKIDVKTIKIDDSLHAILDKVGIRSVLKIIDGTPHFVHGDVEVPLIQLCAVAHEGSTILPRDKDPLNCTAENAGYTLKSRQKSANASSCYRGVCFVAKTGKWRADLKHPDGSNLYLGRFIEEIGAARAFDKRAFQLYGKNIELNFPLEASNVSSD
jgi:hypothetical protein